MLVAFAVGALVLVSLVAIVSQSIVVSNQANSKLLANNAAATAVDLVANDLESLAVTRHPFEYLQTIQEPVGVLSNVTRLMILSAGGIDAGTNTEIGQVRAISYRVLDQDPVNPGGNNRVLGLYRTVVPATETFQSYLGATNLAPAFDAAAVALEDFVAGNIVDFQVRLFPAGRLPAVNESGGNVLPVRLGGTGLAVSQTANTNVVAWAEVTVTVLEDRDNAVRRIAEGSLPLAEAVNRYGFRLSRRVAIRSPL